MVNLVEVELHNNVSGKDKQPEKFIDKMKYSLHDYLTQITTLSEQLKKNKHYIKFFRNETSVRFEKNPFSLKLRN